MAACNLAPLTLESVEAYIKHRLAHVGWDENPKLDAGIYEPIHLHSLGIPRVVNPICSRLLLHGMVKEKHVLTPQDVQEVIQSLNEEQLLPTSPEALTARIAG